jgi:hypothetical protein
VDGARPSGGAAGLPSGRIGVEGRRVRCGGNAVGGRSGGADLNCLILGMSSSRMRCIAMVTLPTLDGLVT